MTHDDATSTSQCIGDPKTPLCAIETVLACFVREERQLCLSGMGVETVRFNFSKARPEYTQRYWVAGVEMVSDKNKATYNKVRYLTPQLGDIAIKIHDAPCYDQKCYKPVGPPAIYLVRKNGDKWMAVDWATPRW
ncbi:MAG: hypothetical protein OEL53_05925 [Rhodospirillales bacterium]|nr:hypothetical protein [Rhodospirillales bacterium]